MCRKFLTMSVLFNPQANWAQSAPPAAVKHRADHHSLHLCQVTSTAVLRAPAGCLVSMLIMCHINTSNQLMWVVTALCMYRFQLEFEGATDNGVKERALKSELRD